MDDEAMQDLENSIRESGLFENLCVVPVAPGDGDEWKRVAMLDYDAHIRLGGRFRVAAGHRRLIACRAVGHDPVKCEIFATVTVHEETIMAGENTHREDPTDFDLAVLYAKWLKEPGLTEDELKRRAGKTLAFIYKRAKLLEGYQEVCDALHKRTISFPVAMALNRCDEPNYMLHFLAMAIDNGLTAKFVNALVDERKAHIAMAQPQPPEGPQPLSVSVQTFQKIECLLCGDRQSYNLQTVMLCAADVERIKAARESADAPESSGPAPDTQSETKP
jgi:ParB-like chromosome segregation protein Spo0J